MTDHLAVRLLEWTVENAYEQTRARLQVMMYVIDHTWVSLGGFRVVRACTGLIIITLSSSCQPVTMAPTFYDLETSRR
jgi:hypothetical protein